HLASDDDIPPGTEDPYLNQDRRHEVQKLPQFLIHTEHLYHHQDCQRQQHPEKNLYHHQTDEQLVDDQGGQDLDRFLALVKTVDEIEQLERKVDDNGVEQKRRYLVEALHVKLLAPKRDNDHVQQQHHPDSRHHGREQEHDRHQYAAPPWIGLDRSENESHIAVEQKGGRDPDHGDEFCSLVIEFDGRRTDIGREQRDRLVNPLDQKALSRRPHDQILPIREPD